MTTDRNGARLIIPYGIRQFKKERKKNPPENSQNVGEEKKAARKHGGGEWHDTDKFKTISVFFFFVKIRNDCFVVLNNF